MRRSRLEAGDLVKVRIRGAIFDARIVAFEDGLVQIDPVPSWVTWFRVKLTDITERLDPPPRKHRRATA